MHKHIIKRLNTGFPGVVTGRVAGVKTGVTSLIDTQMLISYRRPHFSIDSTVTQSDSPKRSITTIKPSYLNQIKHSASP